MFLSPLPGSGRGHAVLGTIWPARPVPVACACGSAGAHGRGSAPVPEAGRPYQRADKLGAAPDCQPGGLGAGLRRVVFRLGYISKSACRLAKIRKRSQLGEILPIRHPAPFSLLSPVDPRGTTARTRTFGRPISKSPTRRVVLERELVRVRYPREAGVCRGGCKGFAACFPVPTQL